MGNTETVANMQDTIEVMDYDENIFKNMNSDSYMDQEMFFNENQWFYLSNLSIMIISDSDFIINTERKQILYLFKWVIISQESRRKSLLEARMQQERREYCIN